MITRTQKKLVHVVVKDHGVLRGVSKALGALQKWILDQRIRCAHGFMRVSDGILEGTFLPEDAEAIDRWLEANVPQGKPVVFKDAL